MSELEQIVRPNEAPQPFNTRHVNPNNPTSFSGVANGDIPVTVDSSGAASVNKNDLPSGGGIPGTLTVGSRVYNYTPPPLGPGESLIP
jgi:hypothetical protein